MIQETMKREYIKPETSIVMPANKLLDNTGGLDHQSVTNVRSKEDVGQWDDEDDDKGDNLWGE